MPRDPEQLLAAAQEWASVAGAAGKLNETVNAIAELVTSSHVAALERLLKDGPHAAVDSLGESLLGVMELLKGTSEPLDELVTTAGARIAGLRIELAELQAELEQ